jgi:hypothetical protein
MEQLTKYEFKGIKKIELPKHEPETPVQRWQGIKERALHGKRERNDVQFSDSINVAEYCDRMIERCINYESEKK